MPKYKMVATGPVEVEPVSVNFDSTRTWLRTCLIADRIISIAGVLMTDIPFAHSSSNKLGTSSGRLRCAVRKELTIDDFDVEIVPDA